MDTVRNRVKKIITDQLGVEESKLVDTASFTNDLSADSLDTVELIMALEEEFKIEVPDDDAQKLLTVGSVVSYIESKIQ